MTAVPAGSFCANRRIENVHVSRLWYWIESILGSGERIAREKFRHSLPDKRVPNIANKYSPKYFEKEIDFHPLSF